MQVLCMYIIVFFISFRIICRGHRSVQLSEMFITIVYSFHCAVTRPLLKKGSVLMRYLKESFDIYIKYSQRIQVVKIILRVTEARIINKFVTKRAHNTTSFFVYCAKIIVFAAVVNNFISFTLIVIYLDYHSTKRAL